MGAKHLTNGNNEKSLEDIGKCNCQIWMTEDALKSGIDVIHMLMQRHLGIGDAKLPDLTNEVLKGIAIVCWRTFIWIPPLKGKESKCWESQVNSLDRAHSCSPHRCDICLCKPPTGLDSASNRQ